MKKVLDSGYLKLVAPLFVSVAFGLIAYIGNGIKDDTAYLRDKLDALNDNHTADYKKLDDKFDLYLTKVDHSNVDHNKLIN